MLKNLFKPRTVAIVGASRNKDKLGHLVVRNMLASKYRGKIYPINADADRILGLKCYPSLKAVPGTIDLVVFVVPAPAILDLMPDCVKKQVKGAIIIAGGFKESGYAGSRLERKITQFARKHHIRLIGPNCIGLIDTATPINTTFAPIPKMPPPGKIAFISQSGGLCLGVIDWAIKAGIGLSKLASFGNKADVDEVALVEYLGRDPETSVILGYLEGIEKGREFIRAAQAVTRKKPILLIKAGTTEAGARATSSHTGALGGLEAAYDAAFHQAGVIRTTTFDELFDFGMALNQIQNSRHLTRVIKVIEQPRIGIVTNSGGPAILATDRIAKSPILKLAQFSESTMDTLRAQLPRGAGITNPVDVLADVTSERYRLTLNTLLKDPQIDGLLIICVPAVLQLIPAITQTISEISLHAQKPIFISFVGGEIVNPAVKILNQHGIANYPSPERAVAALEMVYKYQNYRSSPVIKPSKPKRPNPVVQKIVRKLEGLGKIHLGELDAIRIINAYGIKTPRNLVAHTPHEAVRLAKQLGYPVVMKIASPDILHKTEVGGVRVNIHHDNQVRETFQELMTNAQAKMPQAELIGVSVQEMVQGGKEVIIGMTRDPQFGPLIMFGLGGIYVETFKDVAFRIAPLTEKDAEDMIREVKAYPLLMGVRGEAPVDIATIKNTLLTISQMAMDFPQISELDINPLKIFPKGGIALDARLTLVEEDWI